MTPATLATPRGPEKEGEFPLMDDGSTPVNPGLLSGYIRPWALGGVRWDSQTHAQAYGRNTARHFKLYRLFGDEGELLYIGITSLVKPLERILWHANRKRWFRPHVRSLSMICLCVTDRREAEKIERAAIVAEEPKYNWEHNSPERNAANMVEYVRQLAFDRNGRMP